MRAFRIAAFGFFLVLALALLWRAFVYTPPPGAPAPVPVPTPEMLTQSDLILDLFNPDESALSSQLGASERKRQLEEAITVSFILRRCDRMSQTEYADTYRALLVYLQRLEPALSPQEVSAELKRTAESAGAGYSLIYSRVSCDSPQLKATAMQLEKWREGLLNPAPQ